MLQIGACYDFHSRELGVYSLVFVLADAELVDSGCLRWADVAGVGWGADCLRHTVLRLATQLLICHGVDCE